jgi:putative acetyltransferase
MPRVPGQTSQHDRMTDRERTGAPYRIVSFETNEDIARVRPLLEEYGRTLDVRSAAESVAYDIAELPGPYAPPHGALLLALVGNRTVGCVALRPLEGDVCEMKRLFVHPPYRGMGMGRALAIRIIDCARTTGYGIMRLDTLATMHAARGLYLSLGFHDIGPYTENPLPTADHMELLI